MPPQKGSRRRMSAREQRENMRAFRHCRILVKRARKVVSLQVGLDLDDTAHKGLMYHQDQQAFSRRIARQLEVPPMTLWRAWRYVSLVERYPALAPPACGQQRALWIGHLMDRVPEEEREARLAELLCVSQRALKLSYRKSLARRRPKPKTPSKGPGRKLQHISGAIWHERLVEIRQHLQQLGTRGLVELLAKTWKPEVQQGYRRELQYLIEELTMLDHRIASVSPPPLGTREGTSPDGRSVDAATTALVALLRVLLPAGEQRYLRDVGIATLPLAQLNAVLAPLGYVLVGTKTRSADRFVLCSDAYGQVERYGLFALHKVEEDG
jgi:hypothetical protein